MQEKKGSGPGSEGQQLVLKPVFMWDTTIKMVAFSLLLIYLVLFEKQIY